MMQCTHPGRTILLALGLAAITLTIGGCKKEASTEPTAQSSDFVAENPTESAVPVNLPTTAMTNTP